MRSPEQLLRHKFSTPQMWLLLNSHHYSSISLYVPHNKRGNRYDFSFAPTVGEGSSYYSSIIPGCCHFLREKNSFLRLSIEEPPYSRSLWRFRTGVHWQNNVNVLWKCEASTCIWKKRGDSNSTEFPSEERGCHHCFVGMGPLGDWSVFPFIESGCYSHFSVSQHVSLSSQHWNF